MRKVLLAASLVASMSACKTTSTGEVKSYDIRDGDSWIVLGIDINQLREMIKANGKTDFRAEPELLEAMISETNVIYRECDKKTVDDVAASGETELYLRHCKVNPGKPDIPFKAFKTLYGAQFDIEDVEQKEKDLKKAQYFSVLYKKNREQAVADKDEALVAEWDRKIAEKDGIVASLTEQLDTNQKKTAYVEKVMKNILPQVNASDSFVFETYELITPKTPGFLTNTFLFEELRYPFDSYYGSQFDQATVQRIQALQGKQEETTYTAEFFSNFGKAKDLVSGVAWYPNTKLVQEWKQAQETQGKSEELWKKYTWHGAKKFCTQEDQKGSETYEKANGYYTLPDIREVAARYVYHNAMETDFNIGRTPEGQLRWIWVRNGVEMDKSPKKIVLTQIINQNLYANSAKAQVQIAEDAEIGRVKAFAPETGQVKDMPLTFAKSSKDEADLAYTACTVKDKETRDSFPKVEDLTVCAVKGYYVQNRYIQVRMDVWTGGDETQVRSEATADCNEWRYKNGKYQNYECKLECWSAADFVK